MLKIHWNKASLPQLLALCYFPYLINGLINAQLQNYPLFFWLFDVVIWVLVPLFVFDKILVLSYMDGADFGLHDRIKGASHFYRLILISLVWVPLSLWLYTYALRISQQLFGTEAYFGYQAMLPEGAGWRGVICIYMALTASLVEEILFKSCIYKALKPYQRQKLLFMLLSPAFFALAHWEGGVAQIVATYLHGTVSCLFYLYLRNIWPLVVGHFYTDYLYFS